MIAEGKSGEHSIHDHCTPSPGSLYAWRTLPSGNPGAVRGYLARSQLLALAPGPPGRKLFCLAIAARPRLADTHRFDQLWCALFPGCALRLFSGLAFLARNRA